VTRLLALAAVAACAAACTAAPATTPATTSQAPTVAPSATQATPSPSPSCDAQLWDHVYHPDRLQVIDRCKTVTGTVDRVRLEPDGDTHIDLAVADRSLINQANITYQHGDLVLEQICQGTVTQADAVAACQGVPHDQAIPRTGDHVTVTGSYVLDKAHGWMEIHPVTSITIGG